MTLVDTQPPPGLELPGGLAQALTLLNKTDRRHFTRAVNRLHTVNARLWEAEDYSRDTALSASQLAQAKQLIDRLNHERSNLIDDVDTAVTGLKPPATEPHTTPQDRPPHTETLGSALDRLSVLTLRILHTGHTALNDDRISDRLPALRAQREDLHAGLNTLVEDVLTGRRRLPHGGRFKLYTQPRTPGPSREPISPHIDWVIAFGGLSECGKSISADYLRHTHGAYRLKIGHLLTLAAHRAGLADPYALPADIQADLLLAELNNFADAHTQARRFTLESIHDDALITALKHQLHHRLRVAYLDVPFAQRVRRSELGEAAVAAKDQTKTSRSAHQVAAHADHLIDNSGTKLALHATLRRIARPPHRLAPRIVPAHQLGLPPAITQPLSQLVHALDELGENLTLAALTGSAAEVAWIPGWSDLDLLVIAQPHLADKITTAVEAFRHTAGTHVVDKVSLTLLTPADVDTLLIQPRLLHSLHQIQQHQAPALLARPHLQMPTLTDKDLTSAAETELPLVMVTLRRLLADAHTPRLNPRALYKHIVLACRLLLRVQGTPATGCDTITATAAQHLHGLRLHAPPLHAVVHTHHRGNHPDVTGQLVRAGEQLLSWYHSQLTKQTHTRSR